MNAFSQLTDSLAETNRALVHTADSLERLREMQDRTTAALQRLRTVASEVAGRLALGAAATTAECAEEAARRAEWHLRAVRLCFRPGHIRKRPRLLRSIQQVVQADAELRECLIRLSVLAPFERERAQHILGVLDRTEAALREIESLAPSLICVRKAGE